jgi:hypothetical protein
VDLSQVHVGDVIELAPHDANALIRGAYATQVDDKPPATE